ncbi:MAG: MarR family transcriptional regulator [Aliishimia sp.]
MNKHPKLAQIQQPIFQEIARFRGIIFDALLKPHDVTMSQGWILVHLWYEDGLTQSQLANRMEVATVTVSKLIDRLEARGFVERRTNAEDRRSNCVFATSRGRDLVKVMTGIIADVDEIANTGVTEEDLATTLKVLAKMRNNLKKQIVSG